MSTDPNRIVKLYAHFYGTYIGYAGAQRIKREQGQEYNERVRELSALLNDDLSTYEISERHFNDYNSGLAQKNGYYYVEPFKACVEALFAYLRTKVDREVGEKIGYPTGNTSTE